MTCILAYKEKLGNGRIRAHIAADKRCCSGCYIVSDNERKIFRIGDKLWAYSGKDAYGRYIARNFIEKIFAKYTAAQAAAAFLDFVWEDENMREMRGGSAGLDIIFADAHNIIQLDAEGAMGEIDGIFGLGSGSCHAEGALTAMLPFIKSGMLDIENAMKRAVRISYEFVQSAGGEAQYEAIE